MPKRTNERQQIIELVKKLLVAPNCVVSSSEFLPDAVTGEKREVDVVAEHHIDGDTFTQSIEVTGAKRPADITWVEQMLRKHQNLPTDRLILVSWAGFTRTATALGPSNPRLVLVTPRPIPGDDGPRFKTLYEDRIQMTPRKVVFIAQPPVGPCRRILVEPDIAVYSPDKTFICSAIQLMSAAMKQPEVVERLLRESHSHPEREELVWFVVGVPMLQVEVFLHYEPDDELHRITLMELSGEFRFVQRPVDFEVRDFMGTAFTHGPLEISDSRGLFVGLLGDEFDIKKWTIRFEPPP